MGGKLRAHPITPPPSHFNDANKPRKIQEAKEILGDNFELITAFSREGPKKVYVQHRLKERAEEINQLLEQKAYFYVCGDAANMAREVNTVLGQIISEQRGVPEAKAEEIVKNMRSSNQYQVRSYAVIFSLCPYASQTAVRVKGNTVLTCCLLYRRMSGHKLYTLL